MAKVIKLTQEQLRNLIKEGISTGEVRAMTHHLQDIKRSLGRMGAIQQGIGYGNTTSEISSALDALKSAIDEVDEVLIQALGGK